jgi:hypothetical protein
MAAGLAASAAICATPGDAGKGGYPDLVMLFTEWRAFEAPPLREGAPDYTAATVARRHKELATYRARLGAFDTGGWSIEQKVDREILRAEMNGFDFNVRVLQPWARDPAFYATVWTEQSDTPAHEGPTPHGVVELWTYSFPLSPPAATKLADELAPIPAFLRQARVNLTGNARDLWITGIGTLRAQAKDLADLESKVAGAGTALRGRVSEARRATEDFVRWLDARAPSKTGPSGVGKDHYTWSLRNVHLVPMSCEEEVVLLQRELARAHAALRLEEERNRGLPQIVAVADEAEYQRRANLAVGKYIAFLRDRNLYPMRDSMDAALRERLGNFVPLESRNFFAIATHYEPLTLYTHFYHWWDLARIREEPHPSPIRRGALLYNIWDSRAEGMATAMEEFMLHAGLYDDTPRAREIVWIMLAQRAARGLASLYLQANEFDLKQAKEFQVRWTPRGWMREDLDLLGFEQQLYLRQPGYGTSYITGKYLLEDLLRERSRQLGDAFSMRRYFDEVNAAGLIPVSLIRWQLIGQAGAMRAGQEAPSR